MYRSILLVAMGIALIVVPISTSAKIAVKTQTNINAGIAGVRIAEISKKAHYVAGSGQYEPDADKIEIWGNHKYDWSPAASVGLVFRFIEVSDTATTEEIDETDGRGFGLGFHFVTLQKKEDVKYAPAVTLHYGTSAFQVFLGPLLMPADSVDLPGRSSRIVVDASTDLDNFVIKDDGVELHFFAGLIFSGNPFKLVK